ncbi:hypothetical protein D9M68_698020 [compost metagenome]
MVELNGPAIKYYDKIAPQPPKVKFLPPKIKPDIKYFYPKYKIIDNVVNIVDERYIIINDEPVLDNSKFYGVNNSESITILNPTDAMKKYGEKAKNGAVIITGKSLKVLDQLTPPPPVEPPPPRKAKFPPPIIKPDKKTNNR